jgi:DNA-binding NarL/FixJ family response regulator
MIGRVPVTVLLIDDDAGFRLLTRRTLAGTRMTVVGEADTAAGGTQAAHSLKPEAVLVDVGLPDADGLALASELAALSWRPRVVLTSVDPDAASPDEVERSGACGFVPKHDLPSRGIELLLDGR